MKKAFTLIEMLIVIGIIAVLAAVILSSFGGAREAANLAKCQSNLRNLAAAANAYAMDNEESRYPDAGQKKQFAFDSSTAWIQSSKENNQCVSCIGTDKEVLDALTNGVMWKAVNGNSDVYKCPVHLKTCRDKIGRIPGWSYAMSALFSGKSALDSDLRAERCLMFAEIQGLDDTTVNLKKFNAKTMPKFSTDNSTANDAVLQCKDLSAGGNKKGEKIESIGFNHVRGNTLVGLVAFADGHTEAMTLPKNGDLNELTAWLCAAYDVSMINGTYRHDENSVKKEEE